MFHYCFEYWIALYSESVVYLVSVFGFSVDVKFLKGVKHFSFFFVVNYIHYFILYDRKGEMLDTLEKFTSTEKPKTETR